MKSIFKFIEKSISKLPLFNLPSSIKNILQPTRQSIKKETKKNGHLYKPTLYLFHPFTQVVYNIVEKSKKTPYHRERIFFPDGGHVSLDWLSSTQQQRTSKSLNDKSPICFIMHGLTGGSEMNYIKVLLEEADRNNFRAVCLNGRGISSEMTSPVPFTWIGFEDL